MLPTEEDRRGGMRGGEEKKEREKELGRTEERWGRGGRLPYLI